MSGPGTPAKGGTTTNSSTTQPPVKKPLNIKAKADAHHRVTTQEQSPTYDEHADGRVTQKTTSNKKIIAGITVTEDVETVTSYNNGGNSNYHSGGKQRQTDTYIGGQIEVDNKPAPPAGKTATSKPISKSKPVTKNPVSVAVTLPAEDAIIITTGIDNLQLRNVDIDTDASKDAMMLAASAQRLRKALEKGGALGDAAKADLNIKGLEDVEKLSILLQKDYTSIQEGKIKLQYTDHRDPSFNSAVGEISITHDSIVQLSSAFNKAERAVKDLTSGISAGSTVSQTNITNIVRNTLKEELKNTL